MDGLIIVVLAIFEHVSSCVFCRFARFLSALVGCLAVVRRRVENDVGVVLVMCTGFGHAYPVKSVKIRSRFLFDLSWCCARLTGYSFNAKRSLSFFFRSFSVLVYQLVAMKMT